MVKRTAAIAVLMALSALSSVLTSVALADEFGSHAPGQHVYDRANVLRPDQVQTLERRAATLEALGAPTIVYVRVQAATQAQAFSKKLRQLMDAWDVESAHGAHDGFRSCCSTSRRAILSTVRSACLPGHAEYANAELDGDELDRIATDVMRPSLASGDLAGGISAGLAATAEDLGGPASAGGTSIRPHDATTSSSSSSATNTTLTSLLPSEPTSLLRPAS